nr:FliH/SctL family protein [uncultured Noviherbaspirillum sp.]
MAFIFSKNPALKQPEESRKIIRGNDFWAYRLASDIVHDAFLHGQSITHTTELAFLKEQARGYQDGLQKSSLESAVHMMDIVNSTILYLESTEQQFSTLVHEAVKQIITDYDEKEKTLSVVKAAMSAMRGQKQIVLKVNPEKVDHLISELNSLHQAFPTVSHIEVVGQADIPADACIVHTEIGSAEASISSQLEALKSSLRRVIGSAGKSDVEGEPTILIKIPTEAGNFSPFRVNEYQAGLDGKF